MSLHNEIVEWEGRVAEVAASVAWIRRTAREQGRVLDLLLWDHQFNPRRTNADDIVQARALVAKLEDAVVKCQASQAACEKKLTNLREQAAPPQQRIGWWQSLQESVVEFFWPFTILRAIRTK